MREELDQGPDDEDMFLDRETYSRLEQLVPVLQGDYVMPATAGGDHDYFLAVALGWYLSRIRPPAHFADPKPFLAEAGWRLRDMASGELESGSQRSHGFRAIGNSMFPPRYPGGLLGIRGVTQGCLERLRARAARVFLAVMELHELPDRQSREEHISTLADQLLLDCAMWGMAHQRDQRKRLYPRDAIEYIQSVESMGRL